MKDTDPGMDEICRGFARGPFFPEAENVFKAEKMNRAGTNDIAGKYSSTQIATAPKPKALFMLHDKCLQFSLMAAQQNSEESKSDLLDKAQNILSQLQTSLIVNDTISEGLFYLYDYSYLLLERRSGEDITNAIDILKILRNTFHKLLKAPQE